MIRFIRVLFVWTIRTGKKDKPNKEDWHRYMWKSIGNNMLGKSSYAADFLKNAGDIHFWCNSHPCIDFSSVYINCFLRIIIKFINYGQVWS